MGVTHSPNGVKPVVTPCFSDAEGSTGCRAVWGNRWFQYLWQNALQEKAIAIQKLLLILLACMIWGPWWVNSRVLMHCDNQEVVSMVNLGCSEDEDMMHLMRCLFFVQAYSGFEL